MNRRLPVSAFVLAVSCILFAGCAARPSYRTKSNEPLEGSITNSLREIWVMLDDAMGETDTFPTNLADAQRLALSPVDPHLFICPGTGSRVGPISILNEWADYIYNGNVWEGVPRTVLLASPPENHRGMFGYVLCIDGYVARLPATEVRRLISDPWALATNASPENIEYSKKGAILNIPKRLRQYYYVPAQTRSSNPPRPT